MELAERALEVDYRSVWEFVDAEKLSVAIRISMGELKTGRTDDLYEVEERKLVDSASV